MTPAPERPLPPANSAILRGAVIAILRASDARHFPRIVETLVSAGITAVEVSLTSPGALPCMTDLARAYSGGPAVIGAGTVMNAVQAEQCVAAGATFIMSPVISLEVIAVAKAANAAVCPGALTPAEIYAGYRTGADAVRLFPASAVPAHYIAEVHAPMPSVGLIPTGGITVDDIPGWISDGAASVGLGRALLGDAPEAGPDRALASRARRAADLASEAYAQRLHPGPGRRGRDRGRDTGAQQLGRPVRHHASGRAGVPACGPAGRAMSAAATGRAMPGKDVAGE